MALPRRKIIDYSLNVLLVVVVLVLLIPSWRISFQGWFQGLFMPEAEFSKTLSDQIPAEAQNWALFDMNDHMHNFADFTGKPILLSFWATWCPPCRAELPELRDINNELNGQIHVIAVSEERIDVIQNSGLHKDFSFLFSTTGIPAFFQVDSYPTLLIIDKHMRVVFKNKGAAELNTTENKSFLKNLVNEP